MTSIVYLYFISNTSLGSVSPDKIHWTQLSLHVGPKPGIIYQMTKSSSQMMSLPESWQIYTIWHLIDCKIQNKMFSGNVLGSIYRNTVTLGCNYHLLLSFCLIFSCSMTFNGSAMTSTESEVMIKNIVMNMRSCGSHVTLNVVIRPKWTYADRQIRLKEVKADGRRVGGQTLVNEGTCSFKINFK